MIQNQKTQEEPNPEKRQIAVEGVEEESSSDRKRDVKESLKTAEQMMKQILQGGDLTMSALLSQLKEVNSQLAE